jgi:apolipoprotein N-acyltransferase
LDLLTGLTWGFGYHGLALFWVTGVHPLTWMGVPWLASLAIAIACWIGMILCGVLIPGLWVWMLSGFWGWLERTPPANSPLLRVLLGVALWCGLEGLWLLGPVYWSGLSYTQSPHNLVILHLGQLSGPLTVTAAIVAVNGLLAEAWLRWQMGKAQAVKFPAWLAYPLALCLVLHLIGFWLYGRPLNDAPEMALRVGLIQGNIPNTIKLYEDGWRRSLQNYTDGYQRLAAQGVEAVLTPETALPIFWSDETRRQTAFYQAVVQAGIPIWLGAFGGDAQQSTNSLFMVDGQGETLDEYRKAKLVPIGEYIPFESVVGGLINRLSPLEASLVPGDPNQTFDTPFGRGIAAICYESAFAPVFRHQAAEGGQFILTASNNAHYSATMPAQHHAQDVMRAIESDRWAARATNTGYSGIVDPHGKTLWISGINTYEIHAHTIYRRQTQTLYVRWGDWLTPILLVLSGIALTLRISNPNR